MFEIEMTEVSNSFKKCWLAAGDLIDSQEHPFQFGWLKADLNPPFLEHLSFRLENQLFFIRIDDVDGKIKGPGNPNGFKIIANDCKGFPCRIPMKYHDDIWKPVLPDWGLVDDNTGKSINPVSLITEEKIEMTNWEMHDFAVQVVRDHVIEELGFQLMSSQGNPSVDPSIWFVGETGPEWIVVRSSKLPSHQASHPSNLDDISSRCSEISDIGNFASVILINAEETFEEFNSPLSLWRGHGIHVSFQGLEKL